MRPIEREESEEHRVGDHVFMFVRRPGFNVWHRPMWASGIALLGQIDPVWGGFRGILDATRGVGQAFVGPIEDKAVCAMRLVEIAERLRWNDDRRGGAA